VGSEIKPGARLAPREGGARFEVRRSLIDWDKWPISAQKRLEDAGHMDKITGMIVKVREYQRGQTMAEYALILAAVAVVVFVGYQTMGTTITGLLSSVDSQL